MSIDKYYGIVLLIQSDIARNMTGDNQNEDIEQPNDSLDRRSLLGALGAGSVGISAFAGSGSAKSNNKNHRVSTKLARVKQEYSQQEAIENALTARGQKIRDSLDNNGIKLPLELEQFDEMRVFSEVYDDISTAHIVAVHEKSNRWAECHILPHVDKVFAYTKTSEGLQYYPSGESDPVQVMYCYEDTYCDEEHCCQCSVPTPDCDPNCDASYKYQRRCCRLGDGSWDCNTVDSWCSYDCPECCG